MATRGSRVRHADRSIEVHGCVGERRQVEVLRDAILHALADLPDVQPRDLVVPARTSHASRRTSRPCWATPGGAGASLRAHGPIARPSGAARRLDVAVLRLLGGHYARSAVLDLLRDPFVQARFGLAEEDVERYGEWTDGGVVRWGLDGMHREWTTLPASFEAGIWRRAFDRLLVGTALPPDAVARHLGCAPSTRATTSSASAPSARSSPRWRRSRTTAPWRGRSRVVHFVQTSPPSLFDTGLGAAWQLERLHRLLAEIDHDATGLAASLPFDEFRDLFEDRASSERTRTSNGPGGVTFTSLVPLRNVPFAVVAVLGMDERTLQRTASIDVAFGPARVGDRDPQADVRAALLGAILSARARLIVTHEAADVVTNRRCRRRRRSPSCSRPSTPSARAARRRLLRHPRHAHGSDDLVHEPRLGGVPFSFDRGALARALALRRPGAVTNRSPRPPRRRRRPIPCSSTRRRS